MKNFTIKVPYSLPLLVGKMTVQMDPTVIEETYMCHETGTESGYVYKAEELFKTLEEAQQYCDDFNGEQPEFLCEACTPLPEGLYRDYGYAEYRDCPIHGHKRFWAETYHKPKKEA